MRVVLLARKMGWTLEYAESLGVRRFAAVEAILDGLEKAENYARKRAVSKSGARRS